MQRISLEICYEFFFKSVFIYQSFDKKSKVPLTILWLKNGPVIFSNK